MVVRIRLKRIGRRNRPFYRVCVFDGRTRRDGAPIEELGSYDPMAEAISDKVKVDSERVSYWLSVGAQPSETVASLLKQLAAAPKAPASESPAAVEEPESPAAVEEPETPAPVVEEGSAAAEDGVSSVSTEGEPPETPAQSS